MMVVWDLKDLELLGGVPPGRQMVPYILSADMALRFLKKHGPVAPTCETFTGLQAVACTLEEAFFKLVGVTLSLRSKVCSPLSRGAPHANRGPT